MNNVNPSLKTIKLGIATALPSLRLLMGRLSEPFGGLEAPRIRAGTARNLSLRPRMANGVRASRLQSACLVTAIAEL
jgi:hypothetical protein